MVVLLWIIYGGPQILSHGFHRFFTLNNMNDSFPSTLELELYRFVGTWQINTILYEILIEFFRIWLLVDWWANMAVAHNRSWKWNGVSNINNDDDYRWLDTDRARKHGMEEYISADPVKFDHHHFFKSVQTLTLDFRLNDPFCSLVTPIQSGPIQSNSIQFNPIQFNPI